MVEIKKIDILKNSNNETAIYLANLLINFKNELNQYTELEINRKFNCLKNILVCDSLNNIKNDLNNEITYICFTNDFEESYFNKISTDSNIILIGKYNKFKRNVIKEKHKNVYFSKFNWLDISKNILNKNVVLIINLNNYEIGNNWLYEIRNRLNSMLTILNSISSNELETNTLLCCKKIIDNKDKYNIFNIDNENYSLKKLIQIIDKLSNYCYKSKINMGFKYNETDKYTIIEYNEKDNFKYTYISKYLDEIFDVIKIHTIQERYNKIYDNICGFLDNEFKIYNYCDFKNNKCIAQRDKNMSEYTLSKENGCCYIPETKMQCDKLGCGKCKIKCSACKLIACKCLTKYGIRYYIHNNLELNCFFTLIQRPILMWNFFTPKEIIISKLITRKIIK